MLGDLTSAPRGVAAATFGLMTFSALAAVSYPVLPAKEKDATCVAGDATATCQGSWEKLICDDPIKLTKCFDAMTTCASWNVCDCCSPVPLYKCFSPLAGRSFDTNCVSPIDAREQCCGESETHRRSFHGLALLGDNIEEALKSAREAAEAAKEKVQELAAQANEATSEALAQAKDKAAELEEKAEALAARLPHINKESN